MNTKTGESSQSITQGIAFLQSAFQKTKDKQLLDILSGEISKAKWIEFFEQTKLCYTLLASGYMTIWNITDTYANIMSGYAQMQTTFKENISVLPNSKTKTCMQSYLDWLQWSLESLTLTYKNIDGLNSQYQNLLVAYKWNGWECWAIGWIVNNLTDLYVKMQSVNAIIGQVQKNLDSKEVSKYDELCKFGGIQGLSWLQQSSRQVLSSTKEIVPKLKRVTNIGQYIKDLQNKAKEISN